MSNVFKPLTENDKLLNRTFQQLTPLFNATPDVRKTNSGWTFTRNDTFDSSSTITGSVLFVNNNSFYVSYANVTSSIGNYSYLPWNVLMDTIGAPYNETTGDYTLSVRNGDNDTSTTVNEAIILSFNPDNFKQGIDYDNFAIVLSGSTTPTGFTDLDGNNQYNVANNLVLLPYFVKDSASNLDATTKPLTPTYEMRTSTSNDVFSFDGSALNIDWTKGTVSAPMGYIYPELGLVVLFPELFDRSQITTAIRTGDRTLNTLYSIMFIGGYAEEKVEKRIYFVRLDSDEFNHSLNKTSFKNGSRLDDLRTDPRTYATQIGLYNDYNECLVTAFFSQPTLKSEFEQLPVKIEVKL